MGRFNNNTSIRTFNELQYFKNATLLNSAFNLDTNLESIVLPTNLTEVPVYCFYGCSSLNVCTIPNSVVTIGTSAFENCTLLALNNLPSSLQTIGASAFKASGVAVGVFPNSLTSIGDNAFRSCSGLTEITLPSTLTSIGQYAFYQCTNLTKITCMATTPPNVSGNKNALGSADVYIPSSAIEAYKSASIWSELFTLGRLKTI